METQQQTLEQNEQHLRDSTKEQLVEELYNLGYGDVDMGDGTFATLDGLDEDDLFDTLMEIYQTFPEKLPDAL